MSSSTAQDLEGLTALVTGATSGIGRATAVQLAQQGATVVIHGRDAGRGTAVLEQIELVGGKARFAPADLSRPDEAVRLAAEVGAVDILVNNAGFSWFGPSQDISVETLGELFVSNVQSAYLLVAGLAPAMAERGHGAIVNLESMAGIIGLAGGAAYGATKASLGAMTRAWAAEYGSRGVRVNAVAPGPVYTRGANRENIDALAKTTILGRAAEPEEIAAAIGFLVSPRAAYITGTTLAVDGGRTAI